MQNPALLKSNFPKMKLVKQGKVRDIFDVGENYLIVATDRLSAFDVIMNQGIPDKGKVLNLLSDFWFQQTEELVLNHVVSCDPIDYPNVCRPYLEELKDRSMLVAKTKVLPIECIVRGYLSGSGWNEYRSTGSVSGVSLPNGLRESDNLPEPIFTPSTKAELGKHDENISFEQTVDIIGSDYAYTIKEYALRIYTACSEFALSKGIIIADTKMEFGIDEFGEVILIDELLTPDSSRFWQVETYSPGKPQISLDKQFVRDYLISVGFNKQPPPPDLPDDVVLKTSQKYKDVYTLITGSSF